MTQIGSGDDSVWPMPPMRREQDRIMPIDADIRATLLGGGVTGGAAERQPLDFMAAAQRGASLLAVGMHETLVEIWLRDLPPWGGGDRVAGEHDLCLCAGAAARERVIPAEQDTAPDDIILLVMTAGRPMRLDATDHPLVRAWAARAGVSADDIAVFLGVPILFRERWLGVLAVAFAEEPSAEHVALIAATAEYLAAAAELAWLTHRLRTQRDLAQIVLRDAPLATAVLSASDYRLVLTNPLFDRLINVSPDDWGQRLDDVLPEHGAALRAALRLEEVARDGEPRLMLDLPVRLAGGLTYWDFSCSPIAGDDGAIESVLVAGVDVTARVAQRERQKRSVDVAQGRLAQMVALHQTANEVSSQFGLDPQELLRAIVQRMAMLVGATGGMVFYAHREGGDLEVVASVGLRRDFTGLRLSRGEGLVGRVAITGEGQYVDDYRQYPLRASAFAGEPFGPVAAVPMFHQGQVIGVISLVREMADHPLTLDPSGETVPEEAPIARFTPDDLWMIELFANQAGNAIANARTFLDLERAYQQQRAIDRQKDDFIARASHDLRLPLTSVIGFLDLTLESGGLPSELRVLLQQAADEAARLAEMMEELLNQAKLDSGVHEVHVTTVPLARAIGEVVEARRKHTALYSVHHEFVMDVPADMLVEADLGRLKEVIENLVSNAVKYSPKGGTITVAATRAPASEPGAAPRAVITVSDQGIGIPPEARARLFERFSRVATPLASEIRGTGLGLYLARQMLASMNGAIWLEESEPGQGSTFALSLPLA